MDIRINQFLTSTGDTFTSDTLKLPFLATTSPTKHTMESSA